MIRRYAFDIISNGKVDRLNKKLAVILLPRVSLAKV